MTKSKTLLTPEQQFEKTVAYYMHLYSYDKTRQLVNHRDLQFWIFRGTHHLVSDGDALFWTTGNGMCERYGMTGVTSKGAKLYNYFLPLRRGIQSIQLPYDFIGKQWNDPGVGRCVADLRASLRGRVSANSPATSHCKTSSGIDTSEITFFGLYKSGRLRIPGETGRVNDYRLYLRFYPDGSVVMEWDFNHQGWRISSAPENVSPNENPQDAIGRVHKEGEKMIFDVRHPKGAYGARFEGYFRSGLLWLTCKGWNGFDSHGELPYRFHPFNPDAY